MVIGQWKIPTTSGNKSAFSAVPQACEPPGDICDTPDSYSKDDELQRTWHSVGLEFKKFSYQAETKKFAKERCLRNEATEDWGEIKGERGHGWWIQIFGEKLLRIVWLTEILLLIARKGIREYW
jgi:hypothetical protein